MLKSKDIEDALKFMGYRKSGGGTLIITGTKDNIAKIANESVDIFAKKAKIDDKCQRTAEAFAMLQGYIRTRIHHKFFGKFGLGEIGFLTRLSKTLGHVGTKSAFAKLLHG